MEAEKLLAELTAIYGTSGQETQICSYLKTCLSQYGTVVTDPMHNVICSINGTGRHFLLDAHIDQIGLVVTGIGEQGFLKVAKVGGVDRRTLLGHEVTVWGKEPVPGIISCQPPHLLTGDSYKTSIAFTDIAVDVGLSKEQVSRVISPGDRITLKHQYTPLLNHSVSASFLDDRCGVASILLALEKLESANCRRNITVVFSAQEEVGMRGARVAAFSKKVDEAIAVDVSFAHTPDSDPAICGVLDKGPMIGVAPVLSRSIYSGLQETADVNHIPYQLEIMGETTGTNADVLSITGSGIPTGLISIPQRYMHTPVEMISITDLTNTAELIACYLTEKGGAPIE